MRQTAVIRMIGDEYVAVPERVAVGFEDISDEMTIDRRVEEHRRRHDQSAVAIKDHAREVARFTNDRGIAGAVEMVVHLVRQTRDLVTQDLYGDRVHAQA